MKARVLLALLLAIPLAAHETPKKSGATTVIVVRHAEAEAGDSQDPGLSDAGKARAKELARVAKNARVTAAYATQYRRTKDTAAGLGVPVTEIKVDRATIAEDSAALAKRIVAAHAGETVVVVGHSNTVPLIVKAFGGTAADIPHTEYDRLYVVVHEAGKPPRVLETRYGAR